MTQSHELYRYYDKDDSLLYVGISHSALQRHSKHSDKSWHDQICTIKIERHESRKLLHKAERAAIESEGPTHNVAHNNNVIALKKAQELEDINDPNALNIQALWASLNSSQRADMAENTDTTVGYLSQVCNGHRKPGRALQKLMRMHLGLSNDQRFEFSRVCKRPNRVKRTAP